MPIILNEILTPPNQIVMAYDNASKKILVSGTTLSTRINTIHKNFFFLVLLKKKKYCSCAVPGTI